VSQINPAQSKFFGIVNDDVLSGEYAMEELWQPLLEQAATYTPHTDPNGLRRLIA
jgi:hypothetical protein